MKQLLAIGSAIQKFSSFGSLSIVFTLLALLGQLEASSEPIVTTIYRVHPKKCPTLADGPMLSFVEEEPPRLVVRNQTTPFECRRVVECKVMSSPAESNVYWYRNNKLIQATTVRDITLNAMASKTEPTPATMLGLSQMTHRICVDTFLTPSTSDPVEFKCRVQSLCELNETIESDPIVVQPAGQKQVGLASLRARRLVASKSAQQQQQPWRTSLLKAPLITMIQSTRMELAGNFVQLMCNAVGNPKPVIQWSVLDDTNEGVSYSIDKYPFLWELTNGDLLVDSAQTQLGSISLECRATNLYGSDSATSTLILLNEN